MHLAFVDVLRQLEPEEARLLAYIADRGHVPSGVHLAESYAATGPAPARAYTHLWAPEWKDFVLSGRLPVCQENLFRLGLLAVEQKTGPGPIGPSGVPGLQMIVRIILSDFGRGLLAACAPNGIPDDAPATPSPIELLSDT